MKTIRQLGIVLLLLFMTACKGWYPIRQQLKKPKTAIHNNYEFLYSNANFYQLRINKTIDYLPTDTIIEKGRPLVSDFPYKKFEQDTTPQSNTLNSSKLRVEETYIYLDKLNASYSKSDDDLFGLALYFITYPVIESNIDADSSRTRKYFNNHERLFTNIIRSVQVGYWVKNSNNGLLFIFQDSDTSINVYQGTYIENDGIINNRVEISKVSHPLKSNRSRIKQDPLFQKIETYSQLYNDKEQLKKEIRQDELDAFFKRIIEVVPLIELSKVFSLNGKNELLFYRIPKQKKFVREEAHNQLEVHKFITGNSRFYIELKNTNGSKVYEFKKKNTYFVDY